MPFWAFLTIDRMSRATALAQGLPSYSRSLRHRVDHGQILVRNIAALARQILLDATELLALISMPKL
jgi:hypothetical protein